MLTAILLVVCRRATSFGHCPIYSKSEVSAPVPLSGFTTDGLRVGVETETREVYKLKVIGVMVRGDQPFIDLDFGEKPHPTQGCLVFYATVHTYLDYGLSLIL